MAKHTTTLKEKTMAPEFSFSRPSFSATLLWSAALAVALVLPVSLAHAETLTLICESTAESYVPYKSVKFRIDLDNRIVVLLTPADGVLASTTERRYDAVPPRVDISDSAIAWKLSNSIGEFIFRGSIERETGDAETMWFGPQTGGMGINGFGGRCRRTTQKF